ncbi:uncharacterized protein LOC127278953 [Leptopilina boulardi]|uniref:uncharacterized protein LOC127278953 n=1 Tax=Leptopilina boulardi TaxID=63433 RepID=UPI0021F525DB|nr:uncharacterized protein LOC127278953 [Leptopilina boulardi]
MKKNANWTPTKHDVLDSFLLHIETYEDLTPYQEKKREIYASENLTFQPYPVLCGPFEEINCSFIVIINETSYLVDSPLKAIDTCLKVFFALNASYPIESAGCWIFLQKFVYNISVEKEDSAVNKLITQLQ